MKISLSYKPTPKQSLAHADNHLELGYGGAVGGGKTVFLCMEAYAMAVQFPGNRVFMGRKVGRHFRETTLQTWLANIPEQAYELKEQRGEIVVKTGGPVSTITYGGMNNREEMNRFTSAEYGAIFFDQAEECVEDDFMQALQRLRWKLPDGRFPHFRFVATANPAPCYFRKRYIEEKHKDRAFIQALPTDNPFLPEGYIEQLRDLYKNRPELLKAYIEGSWDILEGSNLVIKHEWARQCSGKPGRKYLGKRGVSIDPARYGVDESVLYAWVGGTIVDEDIFGQKDLDSVAMRGIALCKKIGGNFIVVDGDGLGAGVVDILRKNCGEDITVMEFRGSQRADNSLKFYNKRAEAWWEAGEALSDGSVGVKEDETLLSQLSEPTYSVSNGKILIEDKEDIKDRVGRSPDRADAAVMGIWALKRGPEGREGEKETSTKKWVRDRQAELSGGSIRSYQDLEG